MRIHSTIFRNIKPSAQYGLAVGYVSLMIFRSLAYDKQ